MNSFGDTIVWTMAVLAKQRAVTTSVYPPFDVVAVFKIGDFYEVWHNNTMVGVAPNGTLLAWEEVAA